MADRLDLEAVKARHEARLQWVTDPRLPPLAQDMAALISEVEALREAEGRATSYARSLAVSIVSKHFPDVPQWRPVNDLMGLLSQIDNATTGMVRVLPETEVEK